ncbi:KOW domain-containing RNA-binding protein [Paenibacillus pasadenensis]|uniref:KOW domain-containing RNA-binding protein n=1 Tax=Paenibacillus pasadenensis TaxID=217090 RepID=UPI0020406FC8|nr:KOW domain-containing RNA-binding protein [Paenibacillus pasadenensis]MCM3750118.1 KOW domain-containing RNA-binding protein [Paenibacillus pasadenensis]
MDPLAQVGRLVKVLRGKDEGSFSVIVEILDDRFVHIADGDGRRFDSPKKKNVQHLQLLPALSSEVSDSLSETGRVTNAKLRFAIQKYTS